MVGESPTRARYARNTTFVKKYEGNGLKQGTFQEKGEIPEAEDTDIKEAKEARGHPHTPLIFRVHKLSVTATQIQAAMPNRPEVVRFTRKSNSGLP